MDPIALTGSRMTVRKTLRSFRMTISSPKDDVFVNAKSLGQAFKFVHKWD